MFTYARRIAFAILLDAEEIWYFHDQVVAYAKRILSCDSNFGPSYNNTTTEFILSAQMKATVASSAAFLS